MVDLLVNKESVDSVLNKSNIVGIENNDLIEKVSNLLKSQHKQTILSSQMILSSNLFWNCLITKFNFNQILSSNDQYLAYKLLNKIGLLVAYMNQIEHRLINIEHNKFLYLDDTEYLLNLMLFLYDESSSNNENSIETFVSYLFNNFVLKYNTHVQQDINNNPNLKIDQHASEFSLCLPIDINEFLLKPYWEENISTGTNLISGFVPLIDNLTTLRSKTYDHFLAAEEQAALSGMQINYTTFACLCSSYYGLGHLEPTTYFESPFYSLYEKQSFDRELQVIFKDDCFFDDWKVKLGSFAFDDIFQALSDHEQQEIRKRDQLWVPLKPKSSCWNNKIEPQRPNSQLVELRIESLKKNNSICGVTAQTSSKHWTVAPKLISTNSKKQMNLSSNNSNSINNKSQANNYIIGDNGWNKSQLDPIGTKPASMLPRKNKSLQQSDSSKVTSIKKLTNTWSHQDNLSILNNEPSILDSKILNNSKKFKFYTPSNVLELLCERQTKQITLKQQQTMKSLNEPAYYPHKTRQPGPRYFYQQQNHYEINNNNNNNSNNNNNYNGGYFNGKKKSYFGKYNHHNEIENRQKHGTNQYYYRKNRN
jgi:hypothetical protein